MAKNIRAGKLIYHLTCMDNIESIFKNGLLSRNKIKEFTDVADSEIIDGRELLGLNDYVPFHFFVKNPFDYKVWNNNPKRKFAYLCIKRNKARNLGFKIITAHPLHIKNDFVLYDYDDGFEAIDWDLMEETNFDDYECKQVCMAECLYKDKVDMKYLEMIVVKDDESYEKVRNLIDKYNLPNIKLVKNKNWFK